MSSKETIDRHTYARLRAQGMTQAVAARAAGSRAKKDADAAKAGRRLEREADVLELINAYKSDALSNLEAAWEGACAWAAGVFSDPNATNYDKQAAATFAGRALGKFDQKHEVHVHHHLPFQSLLPAGEIIEPKGLREGGDKALPATASGSDEELDVDAVDAVAAGTSPERKAPDPGRLPGTE